MHLFEQPRQPHEFEPSERPNAFRGELAELAKHLLDHRNLRQQLTIKPMSFDPENPGDLRALARQAIRGEDWRSGIRGPVQQKLENDYLKTGVQLLLDDQDEVIAGSIQRLGGIAASTVNIASTIEEFLGNRIPYQATPAWIAQELKAFPVAKLVAKIEAAAASVR